MTIEYKDSKRITAVSSDWTGDVTSNITWSTTGKVNYNISGTTITRTGSAGWSLSKIQSEDTFTVGNGKFMIEFSGNANDENSTQLGFNTGTLGYHHGSATPQNKADFAIYMAGGSQVEVYESGTKNYDSGGSRSASDRYRIEIDNDGLVKYYLQAGGTGSFVLKYTSSTTASGTYFIQANSYADTSVATVHSKTVNTAIAKPTDVQDNSILVEKDTAKRYWFSPTKLVFEDDFSSYASQSAADAVWVPRNTSVGRVNITNDVIDATGNVSTIAGVVRDIGAVGSTFVLRFKIVITTASQYSSGAIAGKLNIGLFSTNENASVTSAEELIALDVNTFDNNYRFKAGGSVTADAGGQTGAGGYTTETRYVEIKRKTDGDCVLSIFTTDAYTSSVLEGSKTLTPTGTITSALKYFGVKSGNSGSGNGTVVLTIDDINFWNNTTVPFNATWTMTPTLEYDLSTSAGWTTTGSNCSVNTSGQYLEGSSSTNDDRATKALGITLSDTKFVVRQKMQLTDVTTGGNGQLYFGYTDKDNSTTVLGNRDGIGITIRSSPDFLQSYALNQAWQSSATLSTTPTATTYYLEIIRNSATSYTLNLYSDSNYSVLVETKTNTISSSINGLEYITIGGWDNSASGVITARFSDIQIYNGVNTVN